MRLYSKITYIKAEDAIAEMESLDLLAEKEA